MNINQPQCHVNFFLQRFAVCISQIRTQKMIMTSCIQFKICIKTATISCPCGNCGANSVLKKPQTRNDSMASKNAKSVNDATVQNAHTQPRLPFVACRVSSTEDQFQSERRRPFLALTSIVELKFLLNCGQFKRNFNYPIEFSAKRVVFFHFTIDPPWMTLILLTNIKL